MADPEHLERLKQGVDKWNAWREKNPEVRFDLSRANLRGFDLRGFDLRGYELSSDNLNKNKLS